MKTRRTPSQLILFIVFAFPAVCMMITTIFIYSIFAFAMFKSNIPNDAAGYASFAIVSLPILLGIFACGFYVIVLASSTPELRLTEIGVEYRSTFNHGFVRWDEIAEVRKAKGLVRWKVMIIDRNGSSLFKPRGLLFNYIQGFQFGMYQPVIVLGKDAEEIEQKIKAMRASYHV